MNEITVEQYGDWEEMAAPHAWAISLNAADLRTRWRRCSLSADFCARYAALSVPPAAPPPRLSRRDAESVFAYLLNELFENAAKFSSGSQTAVQYRAWMRPDDVVFQMTNHIRPEGQRPFVALIQELLENDPDELYFQKLEENAEQDTDGSGLGYLTLIKDYGVHFGFRFRHLDEDNMAVDVQARVSLEEEI